MAEKSKVNEIAGRVASNAGWVTLLALVVFLLFVAIDSCNKKDTEKGKNTTKNTPKHLAGTAAFPGTKRFFNPPPIELPKETVRIGLGDQPVWLELDKKNSSSWIAVVGGDGKPHHHVVMRFKLLPPEGNPNEEKWAELEFLNGGIYSLDGTPGYLPIPNNDAHKCVRVRGNGSIRIGAFIHQ